MFSHNSHVGIGEESKDLSFPKFEDIAKAFGYKYVKIDKNVDLDKKIKKVLMDDKITFIEIFTDTSQVWEPKSTAKKLKNGKLVSPPLEDLAPFLPREEFLSNMFIKPIS